MGLLSSNKDNPLKWLANRLRTAILLVALSLATGVGGFMLIEHYSIADAFFMTIITISTVGYGEVHPLSAAGRIFTSFYIITNIGIFTYAITSIISLVVGGNFRDALNYLRLEKELSQLHGHTIVCGIGRNGMQACQEMEDFKHPFVVIESNEARAKQVKEQFHYTVLVGDATDDDLLVQAGIMKAEALISTLPNDAANVYVVVTARGLNPKLKIISRASNDIAERKLLTAGASHVVIPEKIGGAHMAKMILSPGSLALMEDLYKFGGKEISFREVDIAHVAAHHKGETIETLLSKRKETMVIGIKTVNGTFVLNPPPDTPVEQALSLILLGDDKHLQEFEEFIKKS